MGPGPRTRAAGGGRPALLGLSALAALAALQQVADPDVWLHLAAGRLLSVAGFPHANSFSHAWPDYPWAYTQWLFGALLRVLELLGGPAAAGLVPVALVGAAVAISLDTVRRRLGSLPLAPLLPLLALLLSASRARFVPRPHLVTYVGLALLINLHERRPRLLPLWFALAGAVWVNCHAGMVFGLAVAVLLPVSDALAGRRAEALRGAAAAAAFFAGTLLNPYGLYPYQYALEHLAVQSVYPLVEFRRAAPAEDATFFVLALAALAAIPLRLRRKDYFYPLAAAAFLPLAVDAVRIVPKFLLVVWPGLAVSAAEGWARLRARSRGAAVCAAAALALVAALLAARDYRMTRTFSAFGWGVAERAVPEGAVRFILRHDLRGRMFNEYDQGGYLAWRLYPGRQVFLDGRLPGYPPEFLREFLEAMHGDSWGPYLDRHRIDYAVVQRRSAGTLVDLSRRFSSLGWPLAYLDGVSLVYVRPGSAAAAAVAPRFLSLLTPGAPAGELVARARAAPAAMLDELRRIEPGRLVLTADFQSFGVAAAAAGDPNLAAAFLQEGVRRDPRDAVLRLNLGTALLEAGRRDDAVREFRAALTRGGGAPAGEEARRRLQGLAGASGTP